MIFMKKKDNEIVDFVCDDLADDGISILSLSYVSLLRRGYDLGYLDAENDIKIRDLENINIRGK